MNVSDIIHKTVLTQEECQYVVESYIFDKTGKSVVINVQASSSIFYSLLNRRRQLLKLNEAYQIACYYYLNT